LVDVSKESPETLKMYGVEPGKPSFAMNCLLARRMIERGVRFVQLYHEGWDHHSEVVNGVKDQAGKTDRASAALIKDLKQRGLLEDTIVIWGGEFGRTPMVESNAEAGRKLGRDHHPQAFTMWLAGNGISLGAGRRLVRPQHDADFEGRGRGGFDLPHARLRPFPAVARRADLLARGIFESLRADRGEKNSPRRPDVH